MVRSRKSEVRRTVRSSRLEVGRLQTTYHRLQTKDHELPTTDYRSKSTYHRHQTSNLRLSRGQAAIEFLITYGWAFLAVLVALGAFSYLGLLSPSAFLPEKCEIIAGFSCTDFQLTSRLLTLELVNSLGEQAILESVALYDTQDPTTPLCLYSTPISFQNGEKKTVTIPCQQELPIGTKMNAKISLRYSKQLGTKKFPSHVLTGRLYALVQA